MHSRILSLIAATLLVAHAAWATPEMTISQEGAGSMTLSAAQLGCSEGVNEDESGNGIWSCSGTFFAPVNPAFTWELSNWTLDLDEDPFVSSAFGFKNVGLVTTAFTIIVTLPIGPLGPSTLMGGSTGGSITDSNFNGLGGLSTVGPTAFYTGMIDGLLVAPTAELYPHPTSFGFPFAGATTSIPSAFFSLPVPSAPGPPVALSIGIQNKFSLSAGDSVASTNFFVVEPIPEPTTGLLLSAGLLGLALYRRRVRLS